MRLTTSKSVINRDILCSSTIKIKKKRCKSLVKRYGIKGEVEINFELQLLTGERVGPFKLI